MNIIRYVSLNKDTQEMYLLRILIKFKKTFNRSLINLSIFSVYRMVAYRLKESITLKNKSYYCVESFVEIVSFLTDNLYAFQTGAQIQPVHLKDKYSYF